MVIAVDIRGTDEDKNFIYQIFKRITKEQLQHSFIFIFDNHADPSFKFSQNVITEVIQPSKFSLLSKFSSSNKISSLLKKYKADVFITSLPIKIKVPQCLIAFDNLDTE